LSLYRGLTFTLISPQSLEMPAEIVDVVSRRGHVIEFSDSPASGLAKADILYATRIQKERFGEEAIDGYGAEFEINQKLVNQACKSDVVIMHPLPRDGRPGSYDLSVDLNADPRLAIFRQTDNGIPIRMAIFAKLLGVDRLVQRSMRDVTWTTPAHIGPDDALPDFE
jgi:aspartate carbamoyltransferase catalytic subunit